MYKFNFSFRSGGAWERGYENRVPIRLGHDPIPSRKIVSQRGSMSTHRMGRDRFPYGPAQPEELPPETHWMDYDTLEEVRDNSCNQWEL